jgi:hypothetical protein
MLRHDLYDVDRAVVAAAVYSRRLAFLVVCRAVGTVSSAVALGV